MILIIQSKWIQGYTKCRGKPFQIQGVMGGKQEATQVSPKATQPK